MTIDEETISEAREWQAQRYARKKQAIGDDEIVESEIASAHKNVARCCADIGICDLLLGEGLQTATEWLEESVEWGESYFEKLRQREDHAEKSRLSHLPAALREHMFRAVLARDEGLQLTTAARAETVLGDWDVEEHPPSIHVYFHSRALAAHLRGDSDAVRKWTNKMNYTHPSPKIADAYEQYRYVLECIQDSRGRSENIVQAIATLLEDHHERTDAFRSADDFINVPASAYSVLAQRAGYDISPADFADAHDEFLLTPLLGQ